VLTAISIFLASISIVMINNLYDVAIDRVSNPRRPLVSGSIDVLLYEKLAYIFMVLALVFAYEASGHVLVVIAAIISNYYIYSVPPVRFKRVPVLSKLVIGFNSFMLVFLGFILIQDLKYFPHALGWIYFAGLTLAANFIDLKDIAGDRAAGMLTLPILLGERSAKILIGLSLFLMSLSFYFVFAVPLPWYCYFISGVFYIYLVNKQHYHDWQVMLLSDVNFAIMIIYLLAIT